MRLFIAALTLLGAYSAMCAVVSSPTRQSVVAFEFGKCTWGLMGSFAVPGDHTPKDAKVDAVLGLKSGEINCSASGGTAIGTAGLVALGTIATLERDVDTLSNFPEIIAKKVGVLSKGTTVRILAFGGAYGDDGKYYAVAEVLK